MEVIKTLDTKLITYKEYNPNDDSLFGDIRKLRVSLSMNVDGEVEKFNKCIKFLKGLYLEDRALYYSEIRAKYTSGIYKNNFSGIGTLMYYDGEPIGYAQISTYLSRFDLLIDNVDFIWIAPEYRGHNFGERLFLQSLDFLVDRGDFEKFIYDTGISTRAFASSKLVKIDSLPFTFNFNAKGKNNLPCDNLKLLSYLSYVCKGIDTSLIFSDKSSIHYLVGMFFSMKMSGTEGYDEEYVKEFTEAISKAIMMESTIYSVIGDESIPFNIKFALVKAFSAFIGTMFENIDIASGYSEDELRSTSISDVCQKLEEDPDEETEGRIN